MHIYDTDPRFIRVGVTYKQGLSEDYMLPHLPLLATPHYGQIDPDILGCTQRCYQASNKSNVKQIHASCEFQRYVFYQVWLEVWCLSILSCVYTGRDRQRDCSATAAPQNRNIGIQQERLHGDTLLAADARLLRATAARLSWAFFLKNTDLRNWRYMDYMHESRATAACHVNAIAVQQVALQHVARQSRCLSPPV